MKPHSFKVPHLISYLVEVMREWGRWRSGLEQGTFSDGQIIMNENNKPPTGTNLPVCLPLQCLLPPNWTQLLQWDRTKQICTWADENTPLQGLQGPQTSHQALWEISDVYFYFTFFLSFIQCSVKGICGLILYMLRLLTRLSLKDGVLCCDLKCTLSWYRIRIQARISQAQPPEKCMAENSIYYFSKAACLKWDAHLIFSA